MANLSVGDQALLLQIVDDAIEVAGSYGEHLDEVADFGIRGEIGRFDGPAADARRRLPLGGEVFRLGAPVHALGGEEGDLPPDAFVGHEKECAD